MLLLLAEGLESALLPCSLVLLIPGVATALANRGQMTPAITGFVSGALLFSWLRFSDTGGDWPAAIAAVALVAAAVLFVVPLLGSPEMTGVLGGLLAGGAAAELWVPCVGAEFGALLNELPDRGFGGILPLAVYLLGVLAPVIAAGGLVALAPEWLAEGLRSAPVILGATVLTVMAAVIAMGLHDEVIGRLVEWSV